MGGGLFWEGLTGSCPVTFLCLLQSSPIGKLKPCWPREPGNRGVYPVLQPSKIRAQMCAQAPFWEIQATWRETEGEHEDRACLPRSLERITLSP